MTQQNGLCQRILDELQVCGPMTAAELNAHLKETKHRIAAATNRLRKEQRTKPKRIYVTHYVFDHEGQRRYPRPVFALGNFPDARRPKSDKKEIKRRYEDKVRRQRTNNFVFNLGRAARKPRVDMACA